MLVEEMLFAVISDLSKEFDLAPKGKAITWFSTHYSDVKQGQMENIIEKFVYEYNALEFEKPWKFVLQPAGKSYSYCEVKKTDAFNDVYIRLSEENRKVKEFIKKEELKSTISSRFALSYTNDRKLLVNGIFLLAEPRYGSINDKMLRFLTEHPNKVYSRKELEDENVLEKGGKEDKSFYTFLDDINVKGDLRKVFFSCGLSKDSICLTNPVDDEKLKENRISYVDLRSLFGNKN